ncbi:MAG: peptidoglycan DD-metalloendopeptidase family protein [Hyphomonadaceae bacterium]|nr:peptidoglycan DD-metalloendopeptidase family protein [Hyphomonadaceae bacterium]
MERDRNAAATRAAQLRRDAEAARREASALDARLVEAAARRAAAETAAAQAEQHLAFLRSRLAAGSARYENERGALEAALITAALSARRPEISAVRAGIVARAAAPTLQQRLRATSAALDKGRMLDQSIAQQQTLLAEAQSAIDAERAEVSQLLQQRRTAQTRLTAEASAADRRVTQLVAEARSLRELAQRVAATRRSPTPTAPGSSNGGAVLPTAWLAPASGQIVRNFGSSVAGGPAAQGITVRTRAGAQVVAPATGEVAYAGLFRSYGHVLILNVEGGYALVFTGLDALSARTGETVRAGQPLGEMAASDTPAPELYVEVRREGQPVDPARWLRARGLTAAAATGAG